MVTRVLTLLFLFACAQELHAAAPVVEKLGSFDYQSDESSPLVWAGKIVIMETMATAMPEHQFNCGCYFAVRDLRSWKVLVSLEQTCNHAFGAAYVTTNPNGTETMWIFGTRWTRFDGTGRGWSGPCSQGNCAVDVFWSNDPELKVWYNATAFEFPKGWTVYNVDVGQVDPTSVAKLNPNVPPHKWIMVVEHGVPGGYNDNFIINNGTTMIDGKWELLNENKWFIKSKGGNDVGSCPTVRYVPSTGYFYVLTGGSKVYIVRSKDLANWEMGHYNGGAILSYSSDDCKVISKDWSDWNPSPSVLQLLVQNCTAWNHNNDDVDITQIKLPDGSAGTLLLYDATNQASIGFAELALFRGDLETYLAANFE